MKRGKKIGPTTFELVVGIFRDYAPGSAKLENEECGVTLLLE